MSTLEFCTPITLSGQMGSVQMSLNVTPFDGLSKADLYRLFDKLLPRSLLHVALPPNLVKFTQLARFMAERAYDLFLASAPDDVCACPSGIAVWALTPLDMSGPLVPLCAVRRSTDIVSPRRYQRPQAALQGCQFPSCLQEAYGIRIAQHRWADGLSDEPRALAQPQKQKGEAILGQGMPPFGEQEPIPCLWHHGLPGRRETRLIQIGTNGTLPIY